MNIRIILVAIIVYAWEDNNDFTGTICLPKHEGLRKAM